MQAILNVRMDRALKERGDKVLSDNGISVSNAVRALWTQLAESRTIPDFLQASDDSDKKKAKLAALTRLASLGKDAAEQNASTRIGDDKELRDAMYDEMWERYERLT